MQMVAVLEVAVAVRIGLIEAVAVEAVFYPELVVMQVKQVVMVMEALAVMLEVLTEGQDMDHKVLLQVAVEAGEPLVVMGLVPAVDIMQVLLAVQL